MLLKVVDGGQPRDLIIREGESFLLPAHVPHSPQRFPHTVGLVIERRRKESWQKDGLRWYCRRAGCGGVVHEDRFRCVDLGTQVRTAIEQYYGDVDKRRCATCGAVDEPPTNGAAPQILDESKR